MTIEITDRSTYFPLSQLAKFYPKFFGSGKDLNEKNVRFKKILGQKNSVKYFLKKNLR